MPHEVRHERQRPLEHAYERQLAAAVVRADLRGKLGDTRLDGVLLEKHLSDVGDQIDVGPDHLSGPLSFDDPRVARVVWPFGFRGSTGGRSQPAVGPCLEAEEEHQVAHRQRH